MGKTVEPFGAGYCSPDREKSQVHSRRIDLLVPRSKWFVFGMVGWIVVLFCDECDGIWGNHGVLAGLLHQGCWMNTSVQPIRHRLQKEHASISLNNPCIRINLVEYAACSSFRNHLEHILWEFVKVDASLQWRVEPAHGSWF